jgi:hypothetical protein
LNANKKRFFAKNKKAKIKTRKIAKEKNPKSRKQTLEILSLEKRIAEAKTPQSSLNLPKSPADPLTEIPGRCGTLAAPRYIFPLMRPPYMKRLSPHCQTERPSSQEGPLWAQSRIEVGTMNLRACARSEASRT